MHYIMWAVVVAIIADQILTEKKALTQPKKEKRK